MSLTINYKSHIKHHLKLHWKEKAALKHSWAEKLIKYNKLE